MEGRLNHDWGNFQARLETILDGSCSEIEKEVFLQEIKNNPRLFEAYQKEKKFREFVMCNLEKKSCSEKLLNSIKNKIEHNRFSD